MTVIITKGQELLHPLKFYLNYFVLFNFTFISDLLKKFRETIYSDIVTFDGSKLRKKIHKIKQFLLILYLFKVSPHLSITHPKF